MLHFPCPNYGIYRILCFSLLLKILIRVRQGTGISLLSQLNAEVVQTFLVYTTVDQMRTDIKFQFKSCSRCQEVPLCVFTHELYISFLDQIILWTEYNFKEKHKTCIKESGNHL